MDVHVLQGLYIYNVEPKYGQLANSGISFKLVDRMIAPWNTHDQAVGWWVANPHAMQGRSCR